MIKLILVLATLSPIAVFAADDNVLEDLETVRDLGELCEYYPHRLPKDKQLRFPSVKHAYFGGLCRGFVQAYVHEWLGDKFEGCGLTPGFVLTPVLEAVRTSFRVRTLREPDQDSLFFISSPGHLLHVAVLDEWDKTYEPSDCPTMIGVKGLDPKFSDE